jgi:hypothetical protein
MKILWLLAFLSACVSPEEPKRLLGLSPDFYGVVPGKILVMETQPKADAKSPLLDAYILKSFKNQPYMNGYSPSMINQILADRGKIHLLDELDVFWQGPKEDLLSFYRSSLMKKNDWLLWLQALGKETQFADSLLLPFLEMTPIDQKTLGGLWERGYWARVSLLLIDTNSSLPIWVGLQETTLTQKGEGQENTSWPPWKEIENRLFTESLWRDFPGRVVY